MASFQHPFQCLQYVKRQSDGRQDLLVASAGRHLYSYVAAGGQRLDVWPENVDTSSAPASGDVSTSDGQARPEKRRRLSPAPEQQTEKTTEQKKGADSKTPAWSNIPILVVSHDSKFVVAVTAEDKCIRVFSPGEDGKLQELSSRTMPKRPSALALTPDGQTILCADKFGDAYSLPLIPGEYVKRVETKQYQPAATSLTVHTKRNLVSLEQQKRQAEKAKAAEEKSSLNFEHQAILGHVSVLTDLISVAVPGDSPAGRPRPFILTADRDEHIRVSRGVPQAHVIEQYCLGHTSSISKLCIPSWAPKVLISGDGDGSLFVWNWTEGQVLSRNMLNDVLQAQKIIVRSIWDVSFEQPSGPVKAILVSLEGSSQLLCYTLEHDSALKLQDTIELSGNVLDLTGIDSTASVVIAVDTIQEPGSTNAWRSGPGAPQILIESFRFSLDQDSLKLVSAEDSMASNINSTGTTDLPASLDAKQKKAFDDSLYNLVNLQKKNYDE